MVEAEVVHRLPTLAVSLVLLALPALAAGAAPPTAPVVAPAAPAFSWARPAAAALVTSGLWPRLATDDLGRDATKADLDQALSILLGRAVAGPDPASPATALVANLRIVRALGLEPERRGLAAIATADGRRPRLPAGFGSEVLARELGMVHNYDAGRDDLERTRRETLHLADIVGRLDAARRLTPWGRARLARFQAIRLPAMSPQRMAVAQAAIAQVGQPYVWAGDWPGVRSPWGAQAHGGFDCSGFVWWAFKGSPASSAMSLGAGLVGRTADEMAFERRTERVGIDALAPGDLVFFGPAGPHSRRGTISHAGIALGNGWMIHSSGSRGGPSISFLDDYWPSATAFGRRPAALGASASRVEALPTGGDRSR